MRSYLFQACLLAILIAPARADDTRAKHASAWEALKNDIVLARDKVFPSLINIRAVMEEYSEGKITKQPVIGSGVIVAVDEDAESGATALALTNYHVAGRAIKILCTLHNQEEVPAMLVGEDPLTDLALLRLDLSSIAANERPSPAALGNSDAIEVGDYVLAMGSPWALARSVTLGIVSNRARVFAGDEGEDYALESGEMTGLLTLWIQHDASLSPGNSGGPLVNLRGEVIGINELANMIGGDMGFAIPSNLAGDVMRKLRDSGEVERSWVGIDVRPVNHTEFSRGVLVSSVEESSPASIADLRAGDLILRIDGAEFTARFPEQMPIFYSIIAGHLPGSSIRLTILRDGAEEEKIVVTQRLTEWLGDEALIKRWGITVCEITEPIAREERIDDARGVIVTDLRQGGPAAIANPPLLPDDIIRSVNGEIVRDIDELSEMAEEFGDGRNGKIILEVERSRARLMVLLKPEDPEEFVHRAREFKKAWLGVEVQALTTELARKIAPGISQGVRIARVYEGTTAEAAGLAVGDIITAINGEPLRIRHEQEAGSFQAILSGMRIGERARFIVYRSADPLRLAEPRKAGMDGAEQPLLGAAERREMDATLETAPTRVEDARRFKDNTFDVGVREITFYDRMRMRWSSKVEGVLVESSEPGGWTGLAGLANGDLIEKIGGEPTPTIAAFRAALDRVEKARMNRFLVVVRRKSSTDLLYVEPEWEEMTK